MTGSQHLYGEAVLGGSTSTPARIAALPRRGGRDPGPDRGQAGRHDARGDRRGPARGRRVARLRRRHRLDAHVLAGQDVDRRPDRPAQAARPPPHAVQPRSPVGRDRHGLHEPQPGRPRRPGVRVHPDPAPARPQDGRRALAGPGRSRRGSAAWTRAAAGWHEAHRLKVARFGDNMREVAVTEGDKVEAQARLGFSVNGYGVSDLVGAGRGRAATRRSTGWSRPTRTTTTSPRALRRGRRAPRGAADGGPDRGRAARRSSRTAGSAPSPTRSRTSARCRSCPASASSG